MKGLLLGFNLHVTHTGVNGEALMVYTVFKNPFFYTIQDLQESTLALQAL